MHPEDKKNKVRSNDRILVLKPIEGLKTKSSTGIVDPRLFTGENKLHAIKDKNALWSFKYERGQISGDMKTRFTSFEKLMQFAEKYFERRNIKIESVID